MEEARTMRSWTFRVENIPPKTTAKRLKSYFHPDEQPDIQVRSIVPAVHCEDFNGELTATISFLRWDGTITAPRVLDDTISVDSDFHGFTPLSQPKGPIAADIIAVTGLAAHAYGSWAHSPQNMWLRDYLPKDVANARVLIYGYPSQLQGSASSGILADHTSNFIYRLLSMRESTRCQDRPIVFIGHSLGCLIIKKALSDVNGSVGRHSSRLPVCAVIFFGAPHRGLQTTALETLVKSRPTEEMIRELRPRSPTLNELNDKFRFVASDIDILTCFELRETKTAVEMPDGSWKRKGEPAMMVLQDSAQLNFPNEKLLSCDADHSQMAKLKRGESCVYPDIKMAIKQALMRVAEKQANVELSHQQLQSGFKAVVEERSRHNGDYIKGSGPERTSLPAGELPLDDAQCQGSSLLELYEKTADVLYDKDLVSAPASDGREDRLIVRNQQAISDPTITPPSVQNMSRDDEELLRGDTEAPESSIYLAEDASSDRSNTPSSPMAQESADRATDRVTDPILRQELYSASQEGDAEKVRSLLAQGCSIHESSADLVDHERDAFLLAALNGRLDVLKVLIQHGCDTEKRNLRGGTALHLISFDPEIKPKLVIESLVLVLEHGVPLEARDLDEATALLLSAYHGKISIAECLLDHGADIHSADNAGYTALHCAAQEGHLEMVALLISKLANIQAADKNDSTALHWAADKGHHEIVALLISKGADIHLINYCDQTALHYAARKGHHEIVALLISKGADINSKDDDGYTALHCAAKNDHRKVVALLISKGADIGSKDDDGYTALHCAVKKGYREMVALLVSKGADISSTDKDSFTALHRAVWEGHYEIVALLISKGACLETRTREFSGPLHLSCLTSNGSRESARLLLQAGAEKEAISGSYSRRALHLACLKGSLEVVNQLLAFGVDIDAADGRDWRALHYAKQWGHWRIIEALLAKGANPLLLNKRGDRPSNVAWYPDVNIYQIDKDECLTLLKHAEEIWEEKQRPPPPPKSDSEKGLFARLIAELTS